MAKTAQDVLKMIKENDIKMVDFKMVDINGQYRHVTIPAQSFSEDIMKEGVGFDASNYGYAVVEKSDMVFIPDPETAMIDPFCEIPTLSMTGNAMIIDYPNNRPLAQYPRNIVLAAEQYMKDLFRKHLRRIPFPWRIKARLGRPLMAPEEVHEMVQCRKTQDSSYIPCRDDGSPYRE